MEKSQEKLRVISFKNASDLSSYTGLLAQHTIVFDLIKQSSSYFYDLKSEGKDVPKDDLDIFLERLEELKSLNQAMVDTVKGHFNQNS